MSSSLILSSLPSVTTVLLVISSFALFVIFYIRSKYSYWERRGVPTPREVDVPFGHTKDLFFRRTPMTFVFQRIYDELEGHKFGGFYQLTKPFLMIRDPELIKSIFVKNFSHFHDRNNKMSEEMSSLSSHLVSLTGQRWKNVRYKLTPTFSSGKLRAMQGLMQECISELADYLDKATADGENSEQNVKELMAKFTTDVIGACAFGLNCNSIRDENSEFRRIGRLIFKPSMGAHIRSICRTLAPKLISYLKLRSINPEVEQFFWTVLKDTFKHRESNVNKRNDFLQLLIEVQAEEIKHTRSNDHQNNGDQAETQNGHAKNAIETPKDILFTDTVVASNAFIFFIAGFETTATTLSHCLYELALHPEICAKLREEVESVKQSHSGNLDYDAIKKLVYMEAVISETLRKDPPASLLVRRCTEAFKMPDTSLVVEEGTTLFVSVYALHHDPKYFPEPEKFKPDRFIGENKDNIVPGSYIPFGDGPRICIAMRFAMYEMKSVLAYIVSNYTIHTCEKTSIPLKYNPRSGLHSPLDVWVQFKRIVKS